MRCRLVCGLPDSYLLLPLHPQIFFLPPPIFSLFNRCGKEVSILVCKDLALMRAQPLVASGKSLVQLASISLKNSTWDSFSPP